MSSGGFYGLEPESIELRKLGFEDGIGNGGQHVNPSLGESPEQGEIPESSPFVVGPSMAVGLGQAGTVVPTYG